MQKNTCLTHQATIFFIDLEFLNPDSDLSLPVQGSDQSEIQATPEQAILVQNQQETDTQAQAVAEIATSESSTPGTSPRSPSRQTPESPYESPTRYKPDSPELNSSYESSCDSPWESPPR
jgi:hypothetical protein